MIIGLIGFGKVSKNLLMLIRSDDIQFITSVENRSDETCKRIEQENIQVFDTFKEVAVKSDILISATSPKSALAVAKEYGSNLIDGAIIGKIDSENPILYLSGKRANELLFLNDFLKTRKISDNVGDAAILKMLRSSYTKSLSALLIESYEISRNCGLDDEFFETLALTEGDDFKEKSLSRIENTLKNSKRKSEELEEIIDYFDGNELIMVKAALKKLNR